MQKLTALFLTVFCFHFQASFAQESVEDWSKKVIELQEKKGQNFEQDIQLAKGLIYLQRRSEALSVLKSLMKVLGKKDSRITDLYETASEQFFFQETAEMYADSLQLIKEESWGEAKDKIDSALHKENHHRLLVFRGIQLGLILNQNGWTKDNAKIAESYYPDHTTYKIYHSWMLIQAEELREANRVLSALWKSDKKLFEKSEFLLFSFLKSLEFHKSSADWTQISKIILKHPEWVTVRVWRLKNKSYSASDRKKEVSQLTELFSDLDKLKKAAIKENHESSYFYFGLITAEKAKAQFEELMKEAKTD